MAKNKPGLPDGFEIDLNNPSQLGDYLDEDYSGNAAKALAAKRKETSVVIPKAAPEISLPQAPTPVVIERKFVEPPRNEAVLDLAQARRRSVSNSSVFKRPTRIQFNVRPESEKLVNDIVEFVQHYSMQNDAKPNEIFDAIIGILSDAKKEMSFADVPRRGKWGTPTARAFPTALGNAFARAIVLRYSKQGNE